jgi:peptide/nickel transport system substrate-binding protein
VKWTDGVPVTSKDVKWSWQALMNPANNVVSRHGYDYVKSIDTPDDYTVVVHLKAKFSPFVNTFFAESDQPFPSPPSTCWRSIRTSTRFQFSSEPNVSDGPFRFAEWSRNDHITLVRNDGFFLGQARLLERIEIKVIPDENTTVNLLKDARVDFMFQASIALYKQVKDAFRISIWSGSTSTATTTSNSTGAAVLEATARARSDRLCDRQARIS